VGTVRRLRSVRYHTLVKKSLAFDGTSSPITVFIHARVWAISGTTAEQATQLFPRSRVREEITVYHTVKKH
jgi:hypothetical protein